MAQLPTVELRRHLPLAQLTWLVAETARGFGGGKGRKMKPREFLPGYAQPKDSGGVSSVVREDMKAALGMGVLPQALYDVLKRETSEE